MELKWISEHLAAFVTMIGIVAWFIRLEAKVLYSEKDIIKNEIAHNKDLVKLESEHKNNIDSVWKKLEIIQTTLNQLLVSVGELKGRLEKER